MEAGMKKRLSYTIEEACEVTGMARTRIYRAIADSSLSSFLAGRRRMVSARALEEFIAKLERDSQQGRAA